MNLVYLFILANILYQVQLRDVTLEEYIKNEEESKYFVFHTFSSRQA